MQVDYDEMGISSIKLTIGLISLLSQIVIAFTSSQNIYLITGIPIVASFALDYYTMWKNMSNRKKYIFSFFGNISFIVLLFTYFILIFNIGSFASDNAFGLSIDVVNTLKENLADILSVFQIGLLMLRITFYIIDVIDILKKKKPHLITE